VLVDRNDPRKAMASLKELQHLLSTGDSLILFPEGTRNNDAEARPFKSGLYRLWKCAPHVPFIPVCLENLNRVLPKGEFLPVPLIGSVTFGAPINYPPGTTRTEFLQRSQDAIGEMIS
jgi:1-acyl-sn-glycerol-3-phosphate acyltransferase